MDREFAGPGDCADDALPLISSLVRNSRNEARKESECGVCRMFTQSFIVNS